MADDDDGEIGRSVVGTMMVQGLAASRAIVGDLEIAPEQAPLAARRTGEAAPLRIEGPGSTFARRPAVALSERGAHREDLSCIVPPIA